VQMEFTRRWVVNHVEVHRLLQGLRVSSPEALEDAVEFGIRYPPH
jgi:predicted aldo/keto reductase-like oxidoreductase